MNTKKLDKNKIKVIIKYKRCKNVDKCTVFYLKWPDNAFNILGRYTHTYHMSTSFTFVKFVIAQRRKNIPAMNW